MELDTLNDKQREAVVTTEGPVMVMAGAGSGKTRVLTYRIAHLILDLGILPTNILAVTFTNKAAREMRERISSLTNENLKYMWISTFHSFCAKLLRIELDGYKGYRKNFTIIDSDDSIKIIREIMKDKGYDQKEYNPKTIHSIISNIKNLEPFVTKNIALKSCVNTVMDEYNARLIKENLLDFDDLIAVTLDMLKEYPDLLEKYQNKFEYILIDEFQDTNIIQYKLIKILANKHKNIFIVGDQDQSIYSFRGAKVGNIDLFLRDFKDTVQILLEQNYRSTNPILRIANNVIANNQNRIKKNLFTNNDSKEMPTYYRTQSSYDEVMFVIDKIKELHLAGYQYKDFAVLYRANALSRQFEDMLVRYQIPYTIYGGLSFFERKEVKDMIAYMRLIINQDDDFSFRRVVNEPKRKIGQSLIDKLTTAALENKESLFKAIDHISPSGIGYNNLIAFKFNILELNEFLNDDNTEFITIIDEILNKTGYLNMLQNEGEEGKDRLDNVLELKSVLKEAYEYYEGSKLERLSQFLYDLALRTDVDNKNESTDCIKLMTYHQAKGLEYRVVFMVAMEEGLFPSINCQSDEEREEERRVCYVGITRAKEKLYITNARNRFMYGTQQATAESRYIKEMGKENLNIIGNAPKQFLNTSANYQKKAKPMEVEEHNDIISTGDKINHKAFGDGLVVDKKGDIITVAFAMPYGLKKLLASHPSIRKI